MSIMNLDVTNVDQMCKGCYGTLRVSSSEQPGKCSGENLPPAPLSAHLTNPEHPFNLMFKVHDGFLEKRQNVERETFQTGVTQLFHFRPKCLRLAYPNAVISFVRADDVEFSVLQKRILWFAMGMQSWCNVSEVPGQQESFEEEDASEYEEVEESESEEVEDEY